MPVGRSCGQRRVAEVLLAGAIAVDLAMSGDINVGGDVNVGSGSASTSQLRLPNGSLANPAITLWATETSGLMSPDGNAIDLVNTNAARFRVNTEVAALLNFITAGQQRSQTDISPAALTGNVTDWDPGGAFSTCERVRVDPGAANRTVNSLAGGADGRRLRLWNISTTAGRTLTLLHDDGATGTAAMRFLCPNLVSFVIPPGGCADVEYDSTSSRWRVTGPVA